MSKVNISVIIPIYNKQSTILRAINSVLTQCCPATELILVDDGSSDKSASVVKEYLSAQSTSPTRCQLIQTTNSGVSAARNTGIQQANGNYLALLDADDAWSPDHLENIQRLIEYFPESLAWATGYQFVESQTGIVKKASWTQLPKLKNEGVFDRYFQLAAQGDLPISASSICLSREAIDSIGGFPVGQAMGEDQWVWSLLAIHGQIAYTKTITSQYYLNSVNSLMEGAPPTKALPYSELLQDLLDTKNLVGTQASDVRAFICTHLYDLVRRNCAQGKFPVARVLLRDTRLHIGQLRYWYWQAQCLLKA